MAMSKKRKAIEEARGNPAVKDYTGLQITVGRLLIDTENFFCVPLSKGCKNLTDELNRLAHDKKAVVDKKNLKEITHLQAAIINAFAMAAGNNKDTMDVSEIVEAVSKRGGNENLNRSIKDAMERIDLNLFGISNVRTLKKKNSERKQHNYNTDLFTSAPATHRPTEKILGQGLFERLSKNEYRLSAPIEVIHSY